MKVLPRGLTRRPSIFGPLGLLGFFGCFCSGKRCLPQKKRDEDYFLRFSFYLRLLLAKKPANLTSRMTRLTCCRYGTRANSVTYIHQRPFNGRPRLSLGQTSLFLTKTRFCPKPNSPTL